MNDSKLTVLYYEVRIFMELDELRKIKLMSQLKRLVNLYEFEETV